MSIMNYKKMKINSLKKDLLVFVVLFLLNFVVLIAFGHKEGILLILKKLVVHVLSVFALSFIWLYIATKSMSDMLKYKKIFLTFWAIAICIQAISSFFWG